MDTEPCRSCGKPIIWAETVNGKPMPVNAEPTIEGTLTVREREGRLPLAAVVSPHLAFGRKLYVSHFATCKDAKTWRRKTGRS